MPHKKHLGLIILIFLIALQWIVIKNLGLSLHPPFNAIGPGLAIFAAAYIVTWGGELAQFEMPQSLAIAFLALVAVLPEYAVDMYFAWEAGKNPEYIHYATANMTGANRLLIGVGFASVSFAAFFKRKQGEIKLETSNRQELFALTLATLYALSIPIKGYLSWVDTICLGLIFSWYIFQAIRSPHSEPEIEGPIENIAKLPRLPRLLITIFFFVFASYTILISAEPFAEGLIESGRHLGIEEFVLVQWLAPLASESPEFIIAILFALKGHARAGLAALVSSMVNQWTLLIGMLPLVYNFSAGHFGPMVMDARQSEEVLLTVAQSFFALMVIANLRLSITEALMLFILFITQLFFTSTEARLIYSYIYLAIAMGWFIVIPSNRSGFVAFFKAGIRHPQSAK